MALIAKQSCSAAVPLNPVSTAAAVGPDTIAVNGGENVYLLIRNADAAAKTITIVDPRTQYGVASPDPTVIVANGNAALTMWGPIPAEFADSTGVVTITYSATTNLFVGALRV